MQELLNRVQLTLIDLTNSVNVVGIPSTKNKDNSVKELDTISGNNNSFFQVIYQRYFGALSR